MAVTGGSGDWLLAQDAPDAAGSLKYEGRMERILRTDDRSVQLLAQQALRTFVIGHTVLGSKAATPITVIVVDTRNRYALHLSKEVDIANSMHVGKAEHAETDICRGVKLQVLRIYHLFVVLRFVCHSIR